MQINYNGQKLQIIYEITAGNDSSINKMSVYHKNSQMYTIHNI